jgi:hypothetical protein
MPAHLFVAGNPIGRDGRAKRNFASQRDAGNNFGQAIHLTLAVASQNFQAFALCCQPSATAVGGHNQRRYSQGDI